MFSVTNEHKRKCMEENGQPGTFLKVNCETFLVEAVE